MDFKREEYSLRALIEGIESECAKKAEKKKLDFHVAIGDGVPTGLRGDEAHLTTYLEKMMMTSIAYTEYGYVVLRVMKKSSKGDTVTLSFSISNTAKMNQEYWVPDGGTDREKSKEKIDYNQFETFLKEFDGTIDPEGSLKGGVSVSFSITMEKGSEESETWNDSILRMGHILLLDDDSSTQVIASTHLESVGHQVTIAKDGNEALQLCAKNVYDVLLVDIHLPVMDGFTFTQCLRDGNAQYQAIPIIALTASVYAETKKIALRVGMNAIVTKPIRRHILLGVINKWLILHDRKSIETDFHVYALEGAEWPKEEDTKPIHYDEAVREYGNNKDLTDMVIRKFIESVEINILCLKEAVKQNDLSTIRRIAHKIKGGAANIMAAPLALTAGAVERAAEAKKNEGMGDDVDLLLAELDSLKTYVMEQKII